MGPKRKQRQSKKEITVDLSSQNNGSDLNITDNIPQVNVTTTKTKVSLEKTKPKSKPRQSKKQITVALSSQNNESGLNITWDTPLVETITEISDYEQSPPARTAKPKRKPRESKKEVVIRVQNETEATN